MDTLQLPQLVPPTEIHELESSNTTHLENDRRHQPPQPHPLRGGGGLQPPEFDFTDEHYFNVLDSMGQAVHVYDLNFILIYWNRSAELLYGYSAAEALGCHVLHLLTDVRDHDAGFTIVTRVRDGETWTGQFPATHKRGSKVLVFATISPFFDDNNSQVGIITVTCDTHPFEAVWSASEAAAKCSQTDSTSACSRKIDPAKLGLHPEQPVALASRISNLASKLGNKMKSKLKKGEHVICGSQCAECPYNASSPDDMEDSDSSGAGTRRNGMYTPEVQHLEHPKESSLIYGHETGKKPGFHKTVASKAGAWFHTRGKLWSWKGSDHEGDDVKATSLASSSSSSHNYYGNDKSTGLTPETLVESGSESWSSSSTSSIDNQVGSDIDDLDIRMLLEDLTLGQQIDQGTPRVYQHSEK